MNGLDLLEMDRWWYRLRENGKNSGYHGEAISKEHLSLWEIYVSKYHKNYDPIQDSKDIVVRAWHSGRLQPPHMYHRHSLPRPSRRTLVLAGWACQCRWVAAWQPARVSAA